MPFAAPVLRRHRCQTNAERLDPFNGLMLTPTYDRLSDRGFITFGPQSQLVVSMHLRREDKKFMPVGASEIWNSGRCAGRGSNGP